MGTLTKRSTMTFLSDPADHYSHRVRIVLAEKGVTVDVADFSPDKLPDELADVNPYNTLPTLVDRELSLFETKVMMEYLDERFPHPPLLPVYPVARAECRQLMHRIERDWSVLVDKIVAASEPEAALEAYRKELHDSFVGLAPIFGEMQYFMSDEFTLVDCCLAPILWRLPSLGVHIKQTKQTLPLLEYMDRLFEMESFQQSLSEIESEMR